VLVVFSFVVIDFAAWPHQLAYGNKADGGSREENSKYHDRFSRGGLFGDD
jgi:hypothetical protein